MPRYSAAPLKIYAQRLRPGLPDVRKSSLIGAISTWQSAAAPFTASRLPP